MAWRSSMSPSTSTAPAPAAALGEDSSPRRKAAGSSSEGPETARIAARVVQQLPAKVADLATVSTFDGAGPSAPDGQPGRLAPLGAVEEPGDFGRPPTRSRAGSSRAASPRPTADLRFQLLRVLLGQHRHGDLGPLAMLQGVQTGFRLAGRGLRTSGHLGLSDGFDLRCGGHGRHSWREERS